MIKLSDFVFRYLETQGITTTFMLSGGGIMHLVESVGNSSMKYVCCHHEQACSIAAQAYAMCNNQLSVCLITTGPGGTNALTGAAAAYVDSTPILFITGQVKTDDFASKRNVRQFGAQENDIISMAKPVTKYAKLVENAQDILYCLQKAIYEATTGRKGPVWLDIPLDIQAEIIDETRLKEYRPAMEQSGYKKMIETCVCKVYEMLHMAKRPLFLLGHGLIASDAKNDFLALQEKLQIPVIATWRALDVYGSDNSLFWGSPGLQAPRYSNLLIQSCDLLIVLGSRLDNMITAFSEEHFAFRAKKVIVDIDQSEIKKLNTPDVLPVICDIKVFLKTMLQLADLHQESNISKWKKDGAYLKKRFPLLSEKQVNPTDKVDLYKVTNSISEFCTKDDVIVVSSTSRCNTAGHIAFQHKEGQKVISSMGMGSMGFALPSVVGAHFASNGKRIIMIEGDGSLQLNIQEFQTIKYYGIDAKMFIFDNRGYAAITTMQERNFDGHYVGSNYDSGVSMPDLRKIVEAYGFFYVCIKTDSDIEMKVKEVMDQKGAVVCEIVGSLKFDEIPKCISSVTDDGKRISAVLENPYPFLDEKELSSIYDRLLTDAPEEKY